ncbi:MAG: biopolymer transporter ExbD [Phycisphaerales bacterium]|nr:biopolymer transporter ExbD [Phycisphaerales bacterium]
MKVRPANRWAVVELTPLVDVVFLLIVFFLIAADASRVARPKADLVESRIDAEGHVWDAVFTLQADGVWRSAIDGPPLQDPLASGVGAGSSVLLRIDSAAPSAAMGAMTSALREAGVEQVSLATRRGAGS